MKPQPASMSDVDAITLRLEHLELVARSASVTFATIAKHADRSDHWSWCEIMADWLGDELEAIKHEVSALNKHLVRGGVR